MPTEHDENRTAQLSAGALAAVYVIALAARLLWLVVRTKWTAIGSGLEFPDEADYWSMAKLFAVGQVMRDVDGHAAARTPGYPIFLALFAGWPNGMDWARCAQIVVGSLLAVFVALLGCRFGGRSVGLLAGLFSAIDPFNMFFGALLLTETLAITALAAVWWCLWPLGLCTAKLPWWRTIMGGAIGGVCVHLHPSMLGAVLVALIVLVFFGISAGRLTRGGAVLAIALASLLPWAERNRRVLGKPIFLTTRLGRSLYDGVGPQASGRSDLAYVRDLPQLTGLDELQQDEFLLGESLRLIRQDPWRIIRLAGRKFLATWNPVPNAAEYRSSTVRLISAAWMIPAIILAAIGLIRRRRPSLAWAYLLTPAGYFTLLHMVFVGSIRYRLPAMPFVEILTAAGLVSLLTPGLSRCSPIARARSSKASGATNSSSAREP